MQDKLYRIFGRLLRLTVEDLGLDKALQLTERKRRKSLADVSVLPWNAELPAAF